MSKPKHPSEVQHQKITNQIMALKCIIDNLDEVRTTIELGCRNCGKADMPSCPDPETSHLRPGCAAWSPDYE